MAISYEKNIEIFNLFKTCLPMFNILSDEKRQSIILLLAQYPDGINVNNITEQIDLSRPAISHHLKILRQAGLVEMVNKGVENYYYLTLKDSVEKLKQLTTIIEENCPLE